MKYEFTGETMEQNGRTLNRIRALVAIGLTVSAGDVGGWIESENNLAQVSGSAWVYGDAQVYGNAQVYGSARVSGNAQVSGSAQVYGNAQVYGSAQVSEKTLCTFSGFGSVNRQTTAYHDKDGGIIVACGCFFGSLAQFRDKIIATHGEESTHGKLYLGMANMIEYRLTEGAK